MESKLFTIAALTIYNILVLVFDLSVLGGCNELVDKGSDFEAPFGIL